MDSQGWMAWWRKEHGIEVDPQDVRDRKRFFPLAKQWVAQRITFAQMADAIAEARKSAKEPIAYLPAYAWQVLCNNQRAPREKSMSAAAQTAAGFGTKRRHHADEDAIDVVATERKVAPARLG